MTHRDEGVSRIFNGLAIAGGLLVLLGFVIGLVVGLVL